MGIELDKKFEKSPLNWLPVQEKIVDPSKMTLQELNDFTRADPPKTKAANDFHMRLLGHFLKRLGT